MSGIFIPLGRDSYSLERFTAVPCGIFENSLPTGAPPAFVFFGSAIFHSDRNSPEGFTFETLQEYPSVKDNSNHPLFDALDARFYISCPPNVIFSEDI
jgi:hypothetical protein